MYRSFAEVTFSINFSHMKVFLKSLAYSLATLAALSGIVYAAKNITTVEPQVIGTHDIIGMGWFQQVNNRTPPSSSGATSGFVLTMAPNGVDMVWQAPKCGTGTVAPVTPPVAFTCGTSTVSGRSPDTNVYKTVTGEDGRCWLASNLGTDKVATAYNDTTAYGWYYQWGRLTDGHQIPTSGTTTATSSTDVPGHSSFIRGNGNHSIVSDWRSPQNDTLETTWGGVNGIYNPCPQDWRLPTESEWESEITAAGITTYNNAFSSNLKLTAAGSRDWYSGNYIYIGSYSNYWCSLPDLKYTSNIDAHVYCAHFNIGGGGIAGSCYRADGIPVRCIKDSG
jgi:uncharacterized protein (TIGR02145 family)